MGVMLGHMKVLDTWFSYRETKVEILYVRNVLVRGSRREGRLGGRQGYLRLTLGGTGEKAGKMCIG